jgi:hypothetical protein
LNDAYTSCVAQAPPTATVSLRWFHWTENLHLNDAYASSLRHGPRCPGPTPDSRQTDEGKPVKCVVRAHVMSQLLGLCLQFNSLVEVLVFVGNINTILCCGPENVDHSALNLVLFIDFPTMHNVSPHFLRVKHLTLLTIPRARQLPHVWKTGVPRLQSQSCMRLEGFCN